MAFNDQRLTFHHQIITGISYGVAICVALARIVARLHYNTDARIAKRLQLDDFLLVFACLSLTAATIYLYYSTNVIYLIEATSLNPTGLFGGGGAGIKDLGALLKSLNEFEHFNWIYLILTWTTIFAVKFGFLSFFRNLVLRLPVIHWYWRIVVGINVIVYIFSLLDGIIAWLVDSRAIVSFSVCFTRYLCVMR